MNKISDSHNTYKHAKYVEMCVKTRNGFVLRSGATGVKFRIQS